MYSYLHIGISSEGIGTLILIGLPDSEPLLKAGALSEKNTYP
jgi:hypothetical protein